MMRGLRLVCHVNRTVDEESYQVQLAEQFYSEMTRRGGKQCDRYF